MNPIPEEISTLKFLIWHENNIQQKGWSVSDFEYNERFIKRFPNGVKLRPYDRETE